MTQSAAVWWVLIAALVAANLPFLSERRLLVGPVRGAKPFAWRLLELLLLAGAVLVLGWGLESGIGQRAPQEWPFFAAYGCLFLTLAFPGFVWRYLRRKAGTADASDA